VRERAQELTDKTKETIKDATKKASAAAKSAYNRAKGTAPANQ
jgi:hypothetical protein